METEKMVRSIVEGYSLASVMIPDPKLPSNQPAHNETYALDFIMIKESRFFAMSHPHHRMFRHKLAGLHSAPSSFIYSLGYKGIMANWAPDQSKILFSKIGARYSSFEWRLKNDYRLVWDSTGESGLNDDVTILRKSILNGERFKVSIQLEDDVWFVLPVDLINLEKDGTSFDVRTFTAYFPSLIPNHEDLDEHIEKIESYIKEPDFVAIRDNSVPIFFAIYSDGTYYTFFDEIREDVRTFQRVMVFSTISDSQIASLL